MSLKKKLLSKTSQILQYISLLGANENDNEFEREFSILINQHLILLFFIFFLQSISIPIFLQITKDTFYLGGISLFWLLALFLKDLRKNKFILAFIFIFLCLIITYYSSYCGQESGVFLFYFPLLLALIFFFEQKKDKVIIFFIAFFILSCLYVSIAYNFQLVNKAPLISNVFKKKLMYLNTTFSVMVFVVDYYFIERKRLLAFKLHFENQHNRNTIKSLQSENKKLLKNQFILYKLTEDNVKEIMKLAQNNNPFFLDKFQMFFPDFFPKLDRDDSQLILSEKHLCAMMRLNLDTKQIATYTNTTVKSVEGKKYRLRKKLNIPSDIEITQWILSI